MVTDLTLVAIPALGLALADLQRGIKVLEGGLHRLIQADPVDAELFGIQPDILQIVLGGDDRQLHVSRQERRKKIKSRDKFIIEIPVVSRLMRIRL
jgi:hypothetical protein